MNRKSIYLYILCLLLVAANMISCKKLRCGGEPAPSEISYIDWNSPNSVSAIQKTLYGYDDKEGDSYPYWDFLGREVDVTGWIVKDLEPDESGMWFVFPPKSRGFLFSDDSTKSNNGSQRHEGAIMIMCPEVPQISDSVQKCFVRKVVEGSQNRKKCIIKSTIHLHAIGNNRSCLLVTPSLCINSPEDIQFED